MSDGGAGGVVDDAAHHRFVVEVDGVEAELVYRRRADRLLLLHTRVPERIGGRGIGGQLVTAAVDRARAEGLTLVPYCPYADRWLRDHPAAAAVPIDWPQAGR